MENCCAWAVGIKEGFTMTTTHRRFKAEVWDIMQLLFGELRFNDHQLHCAIRFAGHVDEGRLKQAVDLSADVLPIIRCRFVEGRGRPYWEECGFAADDMVQSEVAERPDEAIQAFLLSKT